MDELAGRRFCMHRMITWKRPHSTIDPLKSKGYYHANADLHWRMKKEQHKVNPHEMVVKQMCIWNCKLKGVIVAKQIHWKLLGAFNLYQLIKSGLPVKLANKTEKRNWACDVSVNSVWSFYANIEGL